MILSIPRRLSKLANIAPILAGAAMLAYLPAHASSHREAPFITTQAKVDNTDVYLFNSHENGRSQFVTVIANLQPLQDAYGGPNYFKMDPDALYEIHIDNNGDAREDLTFQFRFQNLLKGIALPIGLQNIAIPLAQPVQFIAPNDPVLNVNVNEKYSVALVRGDRRTGVASAITGFGTWASAFNKPVDNIGTRTIPDYAAYAARHIDAVNIPGCATPSKMFVGQRKEAFAVNLGVIFDLINAPRRLSPIRQ